MSFGEMLNLNFVPIKDVNEEEVQRVARFVMKAIDENRPSWLIYKRVVNGLYALLDSNIDGGPKLFIIVIEAIDDNGIPWSYIAKVKFLGHWKWSTLKMSSRITTSLRLLSLLTLSPLSIYVGALCL